MKSIVNNLSAVFILVFLAAGFSLAQEQQKEISPEQKAWMEYMTPGWGHEILKRGVGEWKTTTKFWMQPGAEPEVSKGEAESELILGGRYLRSKSTGTAFGMPMEGISVEGYDNGKKIFYSTWIDNMGTGMAHSEGNYDKSENAIIYKGTMYDPMSKKDIEFKQIMKYIDENNLLMELFMNYKGKEFKSIEMKFVRR